MPCSSRSILTPGGWQLVHICCLLGAIPPLKAWPCGQGIGSQLATGRGGRVKSDSPGQPHTLLGGVGLAELTQGPVETTMAQGFALGSSVSLPFLFRMPTPFMHQKSAFCLAIFLPTLGKWRCPTEVDWTKTAASLVGMPTLMWNHQALAGYSGQVT